MVREVRHDLERERLIVGMDRHVQLTGRCFHGDQFSLVFTLPVGLEGIGRGVYLVGRILAVENVIR